MTTANSNNNSLLQPLEVTLTPALLDKVRHSKVLLVGSGGIGCELLKILTLTAFHHVEVIDMDTIEVSNLNRQFLFRRKHVGMAKCIVACEAAKSMFIDITHSHPKYIPHYGNVLDASRFSISFIQSFDIVFNALDNVPARRHVNRLCLAASIPLIEAGTTGYLGQVTTIDRMSGTECYECQTKPTQKVYPICTVRSTPNAPVHCIVWAKELLKLMLGGSVEDSMLYEDEGYDEGNGEISEYMQDVMGLRSMLFCHLYDNYGEIEEARNIFQQKVGEVFSKIYYAEIKKQLSMNRYKAVHTIPVPIDPSLINTVCASFSSTSITPPTRRPTYRPTDILSPSDCIAELCSCLHDARSLFHSSHSSSSCADLTFNKDDALSMRFVTAASNLRCRVFSITPQSYYDAKGIAGNIIPAIATTNAIVAGLQVLQAINILEYGPGHAKTINRYIYCNRHANRKGEIIVPTIISDANPKCHVCQKGMVSVMLDTEKWTFGQFLKRIVKDELGFVNPSVSIRESLVYEEGEGMENSLSHIYRVNLGKTMENLPAGGAKNGTVLTVDDFVQDLDVDICICHKCNWEDQEGKKVDEWKFNIERDRKVDPIGQQMSSNVHDENKDANRNDIIIMSNEMQELETITTCVMEKSQHNVQEDLDNGMLGPQKKKIKLDHGVTKKT